MKAAVARTEEVKKAEREKREEKDCVGKAEREKEHEKIAADRKERYKVWLEWRMWEQEIVAMREGEEMPNKMIEEQVE